MALLIADIDQFFIITRIEFANYLYSLHSHKIYYCKFIPREVFNMIQIVDVNIIFRFSMSNRCKLNKVDKNIRKNWRNLNIVKMRNIYCSGYINSLVSYLKGNDL